MSQVTTEAAWRGKRVPTASARSGSIKPGRSQNVLDDAALDELEIRLVEIESQGSLQGLVIRSAKPAGFCAGADLKKILSLTTPTEAEAFARRGLAVL